MVLRRKLTLTKQVTKPGHLYEYFLKCLGTFANHQFSATWQYNQFKTLKENLPLNHVICIHDHSENYRCGEKKELQADYFQRKEVSLHVSIVHRHATLEKDAKGPQDAAGGYVKAQADLAVTRGQV